MSNVLGKSRKLVTLFHTSTSVNDALMEKQKLLLPEQLHEHKLIADVELFPSDARQDIRTAPSFDDCCH